MKIKYIAQVLQSGEIRSLKIPQGANNPAEGYSEEHGAYIVYITEDIDNKPRFMEIKYYDFDSATFQERAPKPNSVCYWSNGSWVTDREAFLDLVRKERLFRLAKSDWTQMTDSPLSAAEKLSWQIYRQALRDFPDTITTEVTLEEIAWPTPP